MPDTYKERITSIPPTPISWKSEDSAHSHKARTEILTSLCQNVLTLNVKKWFWSSLWMPGRTHTHTPPLHTPPHPHPPHTPKQLPTNPPTTHTHPHPPQIYCMWEDWVLHIDLLWYKKAQVSLINLNISLFNVTYFKTPIYSHLRKILRLTYLLSYWQSLIITVTFKSRENQVFKNVGSFEVLFSFIFKH